MAWLEQDAASKRYCLRYRWEGKKLKTQLKTTDQGEAEAILKIVQATPIPGPTLATTAATRPPAFPVSLS